MLRLFFLMSSGDLLAAHVCSHPLINFEMIAKEIMIESGSRYFVDEGIVLRGAVACENNIGYNYYYGYQSSRAASD